MDQSTALGNHIRELRQQRGWTQQDMSRKSGLPLNTIRNIENGLPDPDPQLNELLIIGLIRAILAAIDEGIIPRLDMLLKAHGLEYTPGPPTGE